MQAMDGPDPSMCWLCSCQPPSAAPRARSSPAEMLMPSACRCSSLGCAPSRGLGDSHPWTSTRDVHFSSPSISSSRGNDTKGRERAGPAPGPGFLCPNTPGACKQAGSSEAARQEAAHSTARRRKQGCRHHQGWAALSALRHCSLYDWMGLSLAAPAPFGSLDMCSGKCRGSGMWARQGAQFYAKKGF